ncbi:MAG: pre-peptidase C-terminal domain-containing protein [Planctomycetes bacterium]|nr:pre-peptidase C-terminal domain-containing protein [Planctomycetota bacterium]
MRPIALLHGLAAATLLGAGAFAQTCNVNLPTLFLANNGGSIGGNVYFDVTVSSTVTLTGIDLNTTTLVGNPIGATVWTIAGTYVGNTASSAAWTNQTTAAGTSLGGNQRSFCAFATPFVLTPGTYGFAIDANNTATTGAMNHRYTNGTGSNQNYADGTLAIALGGAQNISFSGSVFSPRVANIALYYQSANALIAEFTGTPISGVAPLAVTFTDASCTTDVGGITSYAWDLDGDTIVDSVAQNPGWLYTVPGSYTVSLTVTDASHPAATKTRTAYISVFGPEDECAGAIVLPGYGSVAGSNVASTTSAPAWPCGGGGKDVWYSFVAPNTGNVEVNTCTGTTYDSTLQVFDGSLGCGSLTSLACNDDSCALQSRVTFAATLGVTYYIRVGGFNSASGSFTLTVLAPGAFSTVSAGCGGTTLTASGTPAINQPVTYTMAPALGVPVIWIGFGPGGLPLCAGCTIGSTLDIVFPGAVLNVTIPASSSLIGGVYFVQGADLGNNLGCAVVPLDTTLSDTISTVIGS